MGIYIVIIDPTDRMKFHVESSKVQMETDNGNAEIT